MLIKTEFMLCLTSVLLAYSIDEYVHVTAI